MEFLTHYKQKTHLSVRFFMAERERFAARSDSQYGALRTDLPPAGLSCPSNLSLSAIYTKNAPFGTFFHGGEGEIRTLDKLSPMTVFKTVALNHSATSPR